MIRMIANLFGYELVNKDLVSNYEYILDKNAKLIRKNRELQDTNYELTDIIESQGNEIKTLNRRSYISQLAYNELAEFNEDLETMLEVDND